MIDRLMKRPLPELGGEDKRKIRDADITPTPFSKKDSILSDEKLYGEMGYKKMSDNTYLVSMACPMPGVTAEMIKWWFWWHPQASIRYKLWFPGEHMGISYDKKQREYFSKNSCPEFQNNTHYPIEKIGKAVLPLRIDFVSAEDFGFSRQVMTDNNIELIVCGHVGAFRGLVMHTEMAHIFKKTPEGLLLISRFWLGKTMKSRLLKRAIIDENMAISMAEHCYVEYRSLAGILPELYNEYGKK